MSLSLTSVFNEPLDWKDLQAIRPNGLEKWSKRSSVELFANWGAYDLNYARGKQ